MFDRLADSDDSPIRRANLNRLYALDAILHSRSLTEAGHMVSLGQPAMSMALRRLREHFDDELVSYEGGEARLTALAVGLRPRIRKLLRDADETFRFTLNFDPATATGPVAIAASEPVEIMFMTHVVPVLLQQAPGIEIRLVPLEYTSAARMFDRGIDLLIAPELLVGRNSASRALFEQGLVGMVWDRNPLAGNTLSTDAYLAGRHAALFHRIECNEFGDIADDPHLTGRYLSRAVACFSA